jgi:hypothetical protein
MYSMRIFACELLWKRLIMTITIETTQKSTRVTKNQSLF